MKHAGHVDAQVTAGRKPVQTPARTSVVGRMPGRLAASKRLAHLMVWVALAVLALSASPVFAQAGHDPTPLAFQDRAEEQRFHGLVSELRCVMCQNQSLADSNAQIAQDLRREVFELMRQGRSDREIKDFLVQRYGEFVLYKPQFGATTWLLWLGPALLLLIGVVVVVRIVRRRSRAPLAPDPDQEW